METAKWTCGWQNATDVGTGWTLMGFRSRRPRLVGAGDAHAVAAGASRYTAACGQPLRVSTEAAWPPDMSGLCADCVRLTSDG